MGALRLVFRAEMRRRWRSWLALTLLIALVGGLVLAATVAGRRTASAFPRFVAQYGFDTAVYTPGPAPKQAKLPEVASATQILGLDTGRPTCSSCTHPINPTDFSVVFAPPTARPVFKLVSGHLPDPSVPDQVLASFTLQQDDGVHVGTVIDVPIYSRAQTSAYNNATGALPRPTGPTVAFHVVGFEATQYEFPSGTTPSYDLYATPAFARTVLPRTAYGYVSLVRLRHGEADLPRFDQEVSALGAEASDQNGLITSVEASVHPQAIGWWILAVLAAIVGMAVIGQALFRQSLVESEDYPIMSVLGADRRQLVMLSMARNAVVGLTGAVGAMVVATLLSPIAPLGEARVAETSTGVTFDLLVIPLGALIIAMVVIVLGMWPALRAAHTLRASDRAGVSRPSVVVAQLAAAGAPPSAVVGVRNALERRSGGATVPVGSALLGTVLAVTALCGTGVFGASLSHLTATPRLYGDAYQLNFTNPNGFGPDPVLLKSLRHDKAISGITEGLAVETIINKVTVGALAGTAVQGSLLLSSVAAMFLVVRARSGWGGRPCDVSMPTWARSSTSPCRRHLVGSEPLRSGWCRRSRFPCSEGWSAWVPAPRSRSRGTKTPSVPGAKARAPVARPCSPRPSRAGSWPVWFPALEDKLPSVDTSISIGPSPRSRSRRRLW